MYLALHLQNRICINNENIVPSGQHITVHAVVLFCVHKYLPWQKKYAARTQVAYQTYVLLVHEQTKEHAAHLHHDFQTLYSLN